ncbi:MAG TPA: hypothetical protein PLL26_01425 [Candidatus Dojkabacteria bacterium]|nr:hypothetical protein [Candidatus Dojkabacteria bacterium]
MNDNNTECCPEFNVEKMGQKKHLIGVIKNSSKILFQSFFTSLSLL